MQQKKKGFNNNVFSDSSFQRLNVGRIELSRLSAAGKHCNSVSRKMYGLHGDHMQLVMVGSVYSSLFDLLFTNVSI